MVSDLSGLQIEHLTPNIRYRYHGSSAYNELPTREYGVLHTLCPNGIHLASRSQGGPINTHGMKYLSSRSTQTFDLNLFDLTYIAL